MRLLLLLTGTALGSTPQDLCTLLCNRDGPAICTGGSWTKADGTCQAYLYRGDPSDGEFCYHTSASAAICPSSGRPVRTADVPRLLGRGISTTHAPGSTVTTGRPSTSSTFITRLTRAGSSPSSDEESVIERPTSGTESTTTTFGGRPVRATDVPRLLSSPWSVSSTTSRPFEIVTTNRPALTRMSAFRGSLPLSVSTTQAPMTEVNGTALTSLSALIRRYPGNEVEELCRDSLAQLPELVRHALYSYELAGMTPADFWSRVGGDQLRVLASTTSSCQQLLARSYLVLTARVFRGVSSGIADFSRDQPSVVLALIAEEHANAIPIDTCVTPEVARAFPDLLVSRELRIFALTQTINRHMRSGGRPGPQYLSVGRGQAFSDSLWYLNSGDVNSYLNLARVAFTGELGVDAGGLGREWFSVVGNIIFASNSTDPAGALFAPREDWEYIELNTSRPLNASTVGAYFAVGRFLAISVIRNSPIAAPLPRMFFSRLLNRPITLADVELDDPAFHRGLVNVQRGGQPMIRAVLGLEDDADCPTVEEFIAERLSDLVPAAAESRLERIREGFNSLIPIESINAFLTSDDLHSRICGAPVISVDDLMAHTDYRGGRHTPNSPTIQWLWAWLRRSDNGVRRQFLRFVSGLSQLPINGMAGLHRHISVRDSYSGDLAPRSHTCGFAIDLPTYRSAEELEEWMTAAVASEGFGFS